VSKFCEHPTKIDLIETYLDFQLSIQQTIDLCRLKTAIWSMALELIVINFMVYLLFMYVVEEIENL